MVKMQCVGDMIKNKHATSLTTEENGDIMAAGLKICDLRNKTDNIAGKALGLGLLDQKNQLLLRSMSRHSPKRNQHSCCEFEYQPPLSVSSPGTSSSLADGHSYILDLL